MKRIIITSIIIILTMCTITYAQEPTPTCPYTETSIPDDPTITSTVAPTYTSTGTPTETTVPTLVLSPTSTSTPTQVQPTNVPTEVATLTPVLGTPWTVTETPTDMPTLLPPPTITAPVPWSTPTVIVSPTPRSTKNTSKYYKQYPTATATMPPMLLPVTGNDGSGTFLIGSVLILVGGWLFWCAVKKW